MLMNHKKLTWNIEEKNNRLDNAKYNKNVSKNVNVAVVCEGNEAQKGLQFD